MKSKVGLMEMLKKEANGRTYLSKQCVRCTLDKENVILSDKETGWDTSQPVVSSNELTGLPFLYKGNMYILPIYTTEQVPRVFISWTLKPREEERIIKKCAKKLFNNKSLGIKGKHMNEKMGKDLERYIYDTYQDYSTRHSFVKNCLARNIFDNGFDYSIEIKPVVVLIPSNICVEVDTEDESKAYLDLVKG